MNAEQLARILLVEDNPTDVELAVTAFERGGFPADLQTARTGQEAIDALRQAADGVDGALPNLILLDLNMPGVNGFDVLAFVKADARLAGVPVVVLTTSNSPADRARCEQAGVARYLVKPRRFREFMGMVQDLRELVR